MDGSSRGDSRGEMCYSIGQVCSMLLLLDLVVSDGAPRGSFEPCVRGGAVAGGFWLVPSRWLELGVTVACRAFIVLFDLRNIDPAPYKKK